MPTLLENTRGTLLERSRELDGLFNKKAADGRLDWTAADHDRFKALNPEIDTLAAQVRDLESKDAIERENKDRLADLATPRHPSGHSAGFPPSGRNHDGVVVDRFGQPVSMTKSLGEMVIESKDFKARTSPLQGVRVELPNVEMKTTMTTAAGFAPANNRTADVVPFALRQVRIYDLVPQIPVGDLGVVKYMEETTHTANTAPTAEGSTLPANAYAYTERSVTIENVGAYLPVTEQQLADVPFIMGLIDEMMGDDVRRAEETEILTGSGSTPHLVGFLNKSGVQTQAKGADSEPAAVLKGITLVRFTGFAEPTGAIFHPNDWQTIRLLQDTNGSYLWGHPSQVGPEAIWGVPVSVNPAMTENTALIGAFKPYSYVARRKGVTVEIGYNGTDWTALMKTIRAYSRLALIIRRPSAFCLVSGI